MKQNRITTKISREALRTLRLIAAATGERQFAALDRILRDEWDRVQPTTTPGPAPSEPRRSGER